MSKRVENIIKRVRPMFILFLLIILHHSSFAVLSGVDGGNDPSRIIKCGDTYYWYFTGGGIKMRYTSNPTNGIWQIGPQVFPTRPAWWSNYSPIGAAWAPDVTYHVNSKEYRIYYAVSSLGSRVSAIGLAVNKTLDPNDPSYAWEDRGIVICTDNSSSFNAIDPCPIKTYDAKWFLSLGSYWGGIKMIRLQTNGMWNVNIQTIWSLARRDPNGSETSIENSAIYQGQNNGVDGYWLFVNWGTGLGQTSNATYEVRMGWSTSVQGPFYDKNGSSLYNGGGTLFMQNTKHYSWDDSTRVGPGSVGFITDEYLDGRYPDWISYAYWLLYNPEYPELGEGKRLGLQRLTTDNDGWPDDGILLQWQ